MRLRLVYFCLLSALPLMASPLTLQLADSVKIEPVFFGMHRSDGGTWIAKDQPISFAGWGVRGTGRFGRWELSTELVLMRFFGLEELPNRFSPEQGFSWQAHVTEDPTALDTDYTNLMIASRAGGFVAPAGKYSPNLAPGCPPLPDSGAARCSGNAALACRQPRFAVLGVPLKLAG